MKRILTIVLIFIAYNAKSQTIFWMTGDLHLGWFTGFFYSDDENFSNSYEYRCIEVNDTTLIRFRIDTFNLERVDVIKLAGTTNQYVRGDGSFSDFPIKTGKDTLSGVASMTSYVVAHNYGCVPVITLTPRSADAAVDCFISDIDSNSFTITFTNQPPVGTDNIIFDWVATKP